MGKWAVSFLLSCMSIRWRDEIKKGCITHAIFVVYVWALGCSNPIVMGILGLW